MTPHDFLLNLSMVFGVAAAVTVLFQWLRLPIVLGYLSAGMLIGPHVPVPLVADPAVVGTLAELGVILLMFAIGLEMRLSQLARLGWAVPVALAGVSLTAWLGWQIAGLAGWPTGLQVFAGAMAAISSTAVVAKTFEEQGVGGAWREGVFGVLVVEDVLAVLLLAGLGAVAGGGGNLGAVAIKLLIGLPLLVFVGLATVPRLIRWALAVGRPETVVVSSVGLCFGLALLTVDLGWSVALGAFLAGSLIAESGEGERIEHQIAPIRDLFGALFFVSVGMSVAPSAVWAEAPAVIGLSLAVILGKLLAASVGMILAGRGLRSGVQAGMSLGQIGEFSFVIAGLGAHLPGGDRLMPVAGAVALLTSTLTPRAVRSASAAAERVERALPHRLQRLLALYAGWIEQLSARLAARSTAERSATRRLIGLLALDLAVLAAICAVHGLLGDRAAAWIGGQFSLPEQAALLVVAVPPLLLALLPLWGAQRGAAALAAHLAAHLRGLPRRMIEPVVRVAVLTAAGLTLLAATMPFLPPAPAAVGLALYLGLPLRQIWRQTGELDAEFATGSGRLVSLLLTQAPRPSLHSPEPAPAPAPEAAPDPDREFLAGWGAPRLVPVTAAGKSLIDLNLRARTGATVVALVDPQGQTHTPTGREALQIGWRVALAGPNGAVEEAARLV